MTYKISIVIPVYNAAEYIVDKTLKSIEKQTMNFNDIEIILVNDCSTDATEKVINEYAETHENIVPIHLRENAGGPAIPRNIGITYATADYLMFLDQDDTYKRNACETLYNKITTENVDLVCGNHNMVVNGRSNVCFDFKWAESDEIKINSIDENPNFLTMGVAAWSKIFRREFVIENNLKFTEGVGEDIYFSIRALLLAKGIILLKDFIVVDYQVRTESLSHQINADYVDEFCDFYLKFYDYCETNNINEKFYEPLFNGRMNNLLSVLFNSNLYFYELSSVLIKIQELFIKLSHKTFSFDIESYQILFDILINDEHPFENTILTYAMIKSNREKKFDNAIKYMAQEAKLYINTGKGFNEKESIKEQYYIADENEIEFDLSEYHFIQEIRFDPIVWFFIECEINEIYSNEGELTFEPVNAINNKTRKSQFLTTDSQYLLNGDFNNLSYIKVKFNAEIIDNFKTMNIINTLK